MYTSNALMWMCVCAYVLAYVCVAYAGPAEALYNWSGQT